MSLMKNTQTNDSISASTPTKESVLQDYHLACLSREVSLIGRKEVLNGKAKFGIFGDGKELAQLVLSKFFKKGDFRSGYYRDQTLIFALNQISTREFFSQLYAHTDVELEPQSGGRQMNAHFSTRSLNPDGSWKKLTEQYNTSSDVSPTAGQIPRLLGLAQASKIYKELNSDKYSAFSKKGQEIAFGTIGDASASQGVFFEMINAACVLQVPLILSIWDDGYGISVPTEFQRSKKSFVELLQGFQRTEAAKGCEIVEVNGWDYLALIDCYAKAEKLAREKHIPVIIHVKELTQPQGHSSSGSHERYKSKERLDWEKKYDCNVQFKEWILKSDLNIDQADLTKEDEKAKKQAKEGQQEAWRLYTSYLKEIKDTALSLLNKLQKVSPNATFIKAPIAELEKKQKTLKKDIYGTVRKVIRLIRNEDHSAKKNLQKWYQQQLTTETDLYSKFLYSESEWKTTKVAMTKPTYSSKPKQVDGRIIIRDNFDALFRKYPEALTFGEDVGNIGDVNQGMEGLQAKYGKRQVQDTGIREATIIGQGIGMALRGLRPIAEIQYVDYILYCLYTLSDDLASLHYRTAGGQKAPLIVRTRGHRLEGVWHSGSPLGGIINYLRGVLILVPRNMTIAAGFYNTLLKSDEPALVIESLLAYRHKEPLPNNLGEFCLPVGIPEITREGNHITLVTYGTTWQLVMKAAIELNQLGIQAEVIDLQTLIPFDINQQIVQSIKKTNRLMVIDEDTPGGASAYILQKIFDEQNAYSYLDSKPTTLTAKAHRPAYGTDGDYFSKPSVDDIIEAVYLVMHESNPINFPKIY